MRETLRRGLLGIGRSEEHVQSFLARLQERHDEVLAQVQAAVAASNEPAPAAEAPPQQHVDIDLDLDASAPALPAAQAAAAFSVGDWFELVSQRRAVRTQLTWASPQQTLFLFTAPDGSTQSMTRRMCDKLMAEGSLRVLPPPGQ
jgi:menaquinone-dependent protoporphyrinogen IX oxidase